jgi:hypothetical protein
MKKLKTRVFGKKKTLSWCSSQLSMGLDQFSAS